MSGTMLKAFFTLPHSILIATTEAQRSKTTYPGHRTDKWKCSVPMICDPALHTNLGCNSVIILHINIHLSNTSST